jgi:hypothetical protein
VGGVTFSVDDHVVNQVLSVTDKAGGPINSGAIALPAEHAEVFYRNIPIEQLPSCSRPARSPVTGRAPAPGKSKVGGRGFEAANDPQVVPPGGPLYHDDSALWHSLTSRSVL